MKKLEKIKNVTKKLLESNELKMLIGGAAEGTTYKSCETKTDTTPSCPCGDVTYKSYTDTNSEEWKELLSYTDCITCPT